MCALYKRNVRERPCKNFVSQSNDLFTSTAASQSGGYRQTKTRRKNHLLFAEKPQDRKRVACRRRLSRSVKRTTVFKRLIRLDHRRSFVKTIHQLFLKIDKITSLSIDFDLINNLLCKFCLIYKIKIQDFPHTAMSRPSLKKRRRIYCAAAFISFYCNGKCFYSRPFLPFSSSWFSVLLSSFSVVLSLPVIPPFSCLLS